MLFGNLNFVGLGIVMELERIEIEAVIQLVIAVEVVVEIVFDFGFD